MAGKFLGFTTQNKLAKNDSETDFFKFFKNAFFAKKVENVQNCVKLVIFKKDDTEKKKLNSDQK